MKERSTIRDVAQKANVSIATVSRYLNNAARVSPDAARRIRDAISVTDYTPNLAARMLKEQDNHVILLVVPDICNPFYSTLAKAAQKLARERDYYFMLFDSNEDTDEEIAAIRFAQQMQASGILFASIDIRPKVVAALKDCQMPIVGLNAYEEHFLHDVVHVHKSGGTYLAVKHLLGLGHTRIAYAGGTPGSMIAQSRKQGYETAMKEVGLACSESFVFEMGFSQEDGQKAGRYFSTLRPLPTAICCANDQIALGLIDALNGSGLSVPGDISVTGMDNIPYGRMSTPSLTTVTNDSAAFAQMGIELLFERIEARYTGEPRRRDVPNQLIARESTAPIPTN